MSKQKSSAKKQVILIIVGLLIAVSGIISLGTSLGAGVVALVVGLVLFAIGLVPMLSARKKDSVKSTSSPVNSAPPKGYKPASSAPVTVRSTPTPVHRKPDPPKYDYFKFNHLSALPESYICIDFETTGLYPERDRITEAAAARVENGVIVDTFSSLVHSTVSIDSYVAGLTGITNDMIADAPPEKDVLSKLLDFIGVFPVIGYNISFDLSFLFYAAARLGRSCPKDTFDVLPLAKKCLQQRSGYKLSAVAGYLSVDQPEAHRALADVLTTVACAEKLRPMILEIEEKERVEAARQKRIAEYDFSKINVDYKAIIPTVEPVPTDTPFSGKRVVFTRELGRMTRAVACQIVANLGGQPHEKVTKGTAFLVVGDGAPSPYDEPGQPTRKELKAEEWQAKGSMIRVITETEFFDMIEGCKK